MDDQKKRWIIPPPLLRFLENCLPAFSTGFSSEKNSLAGLSDGIPTRMK